MDATILIVDDSIEITSYLSEFLSEAGLSVRAANTGRTAMELIRQGGIDLIFLDIVMPDIDGYELCELLKGENATKDIPVIFLSGLDDSLDKERAFQIGAVDYITKPFEHREVLARVRTHVHMDKMRRRLESLNGELEKLVEVRTAALRSTINGLDKALQAREDFLALVSHELRTPLNAILGMVSLLEPTLEASQVEYFETIKSSGWDLCRLIDDMITVAGRGGDSLDSTGGSEEIEDVSSLCEECLNRERPSAEKKGITAEFEAGQLGDARPSVTRSELRQILGNLLDNAVRFTPAGGRIGLRLHLNRQQGRFFLDVWDTGPGVPDSEKSRVFQPFIQLEPVLTRRHGGLGLGLTLAKRLVRVHGGRIEVSDRVGGGSLFRVGLPFVSAKG